MPIFTPSESGAWSFALAAGLVLAAPADSTSVLDRAARGATATELLDGLIRDGISAAPPFLLVEQGAAEGVVRVIVRGDAVARIAQPTGVTRLNGSGVTTWSEQLFEGVTAIDAEVPGGSLRVPVGGSASQEAPASPAPASAPASVSAPAPSVSEPAPAAAPAPLPAPSPAPVAAPSSPFITAPSVAPDPELTIAPPADPEATIAPFELIQQASEEPAGYDHLFGETVIRDIAAAAVRDEVPAEEASPGVAAGTFDDGDHDGRTVLTSDLPRRAPQERPARTVSPVAAEPRYELELPGSRRERIDRALILGRSPSATRVAGSELPRLVTIGGDDNDISRSHIRVAVEGGTVVVTDLHSRNGTHVVLPGRPAQRLRPGEPTSVIPGAVLDLGGGIVVTVVESA